MRNPLKFIAETQRLDLTTFVEYAVGKAQKYSLELNSSELSLSTVSNWYCDDLVKDYKAYRDALAKVLSS